MKNISGLEKYFIDEEGRVFSTVKETPRELKMHLNYKGYLQIKILGKSYKIHRLVAQAFIPNPNNLPQVNHIDGNKTNNTVENSEWVDNSTNQLHAWANNLQPKRHASNISLTQEQANAIRKEYVESNIGTIELSRKYEVSKTTIKDILNAKYYNLDKTVKPVTRKKTMPQLTPEQVNEIRDLHSTGNYSYNMLGNMFGVNHKTIKKITDGKSYRYIEPVTTNQKE